MFKKVDPKQNFPEMEKNILRFWKKDKIFEKSVEENEGKKTYSFFDGPPFATGLPHYGHIVASLIKDAVPRYWTMRGYKVERRWGWDCHGLPVENLVEKEHNIKNKRDIEKWGIDKFNDACYASVLRYADDWKKFIPRIGRWVDMDNDYKTMDWKYIESIWWVFSELYKKGLIYEDYKPMHICPRCETTLSNFEVTQGYKEITDLSVMVKFKLKAGQKIGNFTTDENVYVLAWTTTPWTLPGNVALAVGKDIDYLKVKTFNKEKQCCEYVILAKDIYEKIGKEDERNVALYKKLYPMQFVSKEIKSDIAIEECEEFKSKDLVALEYEPLFDYCSKKEDLKNKENGWKIYAGDFVSTEEGTGIVHIAPAFGEDDMKMGKKYKLPFIQHVGMDGRFTDEVIDFRDKDGRGKEVKPKRNPRETDEEIVKYLEKNSKVFREENYKHSYPHCWRCDTPLLNYAASSWFVKVTEIKERMIKNNRQINWVPEYIKEGRFGKWLEDARDWAVSRNRYWGAPVPIWKCGGKSQKSGGCGNLIVVGNRKDLGKLAIGGNTLIVVRHGETDWNREKRMLGWTDMELNKTGQRQAKALVGLLKKEKVDVVISSPLKRALQTAEIVTQNKVEILKNDLLKERSMGDFEGMTRGEIVKKYPKALYYLVKEHYYWKNIPNGESFISVKERVDKFIEEVNNNYQGKTILVFSHAGFLDMLYVKFNNGDYQKGLGHHGKNCSVEKYNLVEMVDLHRPAIDEVILKCPQCGDKAHRTSDVLDCWFESGSMPYAQGHYPFENRDKFENSFPADFIAEGLDQTRGWFYTLIVLSTALFNKPAFKNVIVNGIVLAEDGQKMSKRLKNYPEPNILIEKYGADALRYYLVTSPAMKSENLRFSEKGVDEVLKKFILTLWNAYSFLVMNVNLDKDVKEIVRQIQSDKKKSDNLLDRWIVSELNILVQEVNKQMEDYDLVRASRPLREFSDKLSNWYVRRSRKRFSSEDIKDRNFAFQTLYYVLIEYSKLLAPFMPFLAEEIYKNLTEKESVHLEDYPVADKNLIDKKISSEMNFVRNVVALGLSIRAKNSVKVRMPLSELRIMNHELRIKEEFLDLIKDELNVKSVEFVEDLQAGFTQESEANNRASDNWAIEEDAGLKIALDLNITKELKSEGFAREIVRHIQVMRKEAKYDRNDVIFVKYNFTGSDKSIKKVFSEWRNYIKKECLTKDIVFNKKLGKDNFDLVKEIEIGNWKLEIGIKKLSSR